MRLMIAIAVLSQLLVACGPKTGISSSEAEQQSKEWGQDAYEQAMIKAGREDELKAEKEKWAASQAQSGRDQQASQDQGQSQSPTAASESKPKAPGSLGG